MKICILTSGFPRFKGDLFGVFVYNLAKELVKQDIEVFVLAPFDIGTPRFEIVDNIKVVRFPYFCPYKLQKLCYGSGISSNIKKSFLATLQLPIFFLLQLIFLIRLVKKENINIINSHWMVFQGINGALIRKFYGTKHILTVHAAGLFALKRFHLGSTIAKFIVKNSDEIFTVSTYIRDELDKLLGFRSQALVLPMGVDVEKFGTFITRDSELIHRYGLEGKKILLFVGRLVEKKGVIYLIKGASILSEKTKDFKLLIVGDGYLKDYLEKLVDREGLSNFILFLGNQPNHLIPKFLSIADLIIVPSIIDSSGETEGMPVIILEAMAAAKVVIASKVSGVVDIIQDGFNGYLSVPGDPEDIEKKILQAFQEDKLKEIGQNAYDTATRYAWPKIGENYYRQILKLSS